jgi:hypothetical protein
MSAIPLHNSSDLIRLFKICVMNLDFKIKFPSKYENLEVNM